MERWFGKVALVTGAGSGIGAAVTEELVKNGVNVFALDISFERVENLKNKISDAKGEIIPIQGDVRKQEDIVSAFKAIREKFGVIHILVNNAGVILLGTLIDGSPDHFKDVMDINFMGYVLCTQQALKLMNESNVDDGHIVNVNSITGHRIYNIPEWNVYPASKYAVTALTEITRYEAILMKTNIRTTSISPTPVATNILSAELNEKYLDDDQKPKAKNYTKMKLLKPKDVADSILFALSTPPHVQIREIKISATGPNSEDF